MSSTKNLVAVGQINVQPCQYINRLVLKLLSIGSSHRSIWMTNLYIGGKTINLFIRLFVNWPGKLCIVATSVPSESLFSICRNVISQKRACLTPQYAEHLILLHENLSLLHQEYKRKLRNCKCIQCISWLHYFHVCCKKWFFFTVWTRIIMCMQDFNIFMVMSKLAN